MSKKTELTVEQKMAVAIEKAKEARKVAKDEARLALLDNEKYVDYLASVEDESDQVKSLTTIMEQLNKMKPIVTNDGSKYGVNIYPVAEYVFGPVASRVVGIIAGSSAMFTDERQAEFEAITGLNYLTCAKARDAIGSPAYYSKGVLANHIPGNGDDVKNAVTAVCIALNIDLDYANKVNSSTIDKWFTIAKAKADKQYGEFKKTEIVDADNKFVLED
jgi:hypothetical protein